MYHTIHGLLLVTFICLLASLSRADRHLVDRRRAHKVNCERFVFAPICRGVAAKRNVILTTNTVDVIPEPETLDDMVWKSFLSLPMNPDSKMYLQRQERLKYPLLDKVRRSSGKLWQQIARPEQQNDQDGIMSPRSLITRRDSNGKTRSEFKNIITTVFNQP